VHRVRLIRYLTVRGEISDFVRGLCRTRWVVFPLDLSVLVEDVDEFLADFYFYQCFASVPAEVSLMDVYTVPSFAMASGYPCEWVPMPNFVFATTSFARTEASWKTTGLLDI
jgi:hypothetical protein